MSTDAMDLIASEKAKADQKVLQLQKSLEESEKALKDQETFFEDLQTIHKEVQ